MIKNPGQVGCLNNALVEISNDVKHRTPRHIHAHLPRQHWHEEVTLDLLCTVLEPPPTCLFRQTSFLPRRTDIWRDTFDLMLSNFLVLDHLMMKLKSSNMAKRSKVRKMVEKSKIHSPHRSKVRRMYMEIQVGFIM